MHIFIFENYTLTIVFSPLFSSLDDKCKLVIHRQKLRLWRIKMPCLWLTSMLSLMAILRIYQPSKLLHLPTLCDYPIETIFQLSKMYKESHQHRQKHELVKVRSHWVTATATEKLFSVVSVHIGGCQRHLNIFPFMNRSNGIQWGCSYWGGWQRQWHNIIYIYFFLFAIAVAVTNGYQTHSMTLPSMSLLPLPLPPPSVNTSIGFH